MATPEHVYASVLLLKSVPADKSGVMVTADIETGQPGWLTIAVNEGVGGAVSGQTAEELRVNLENGRVRLMAHAAEPQKRIILSEGGMTKIEASGTQAVLNRKEIDLLIDFAGSVPDRFPRFKDTAGHPVPADIEFGFYQNKLVLFQIRPFLESSRARQSLYLNHLDQNLRDKQSLTVDLNGIPAEENE
jgi:phosphoenolpyruvate synthase/pyruvate phosphate dikinase